MDTDHGSLVAALEQLSRLLRYLPEMILVFVGLLTGTLSLRRIRQRYRLRHRMDPDDTGPKTPS